MTDEPTIPRDGADEAAALAEFYGAEEAADAARLRELIELGPERMGDDGWRELRAIASRSPRHGEYRSRLQLGDTLYIKTWADECDWFRRYYEESGLGEGIAHVVCLPAVYPVVWLLMAGSLVNAGALDEARKFAEVSVALEEHPTSLCELATILGRDGKTETALGLFVHAYEMREDTPPWALARAARGVGVSLVDLDRLDEAEVILRQSLELDEDNPIALGELEYIEERRASTATAAPARPRTMSGLDVETAPGGEDGLPN